MIVRSLLLSAIVSIGLSTAALADDAGAAQAASMFSSCMRYAGDTAGLRTWATGAGLKEASASDAKPYLLGHSGRAFGGQTRNGKDGMTVVSRDYHISQDKDRWHVVISTSTPGKARFEAVMTVAGHVHKN